MKPTERPGFLDDQLGDHKIPLPDELNWAALGDQIIPPKKEPKRPLMFWWLVLMAGILAGGSAWYFGIDFFGTEDSANSRTVEVTPQLSLVEAVERVETVPYEQGLSFATSSAKVKSLEKAIRGGGKAMNPRDATRNFNNDLGDAAVNTRYRSRQEFSTGDNQLSEVEEMQPDKRSSEHLSTQESKVVLPLEPTTIKPIPEQKMIPTIVHSLSAVANRSCHYLQLTVGTAVFPELLTPYDALFDPQLGLNWEYNSRNRWKIGAGLRWGRQSWRTQLLKRENVQLYRPGTIDTIYRNVDTGEERIITTDSIAGILETRFAGYGEIDLLSLSLVVGRRWPVLGGEFSLGLGLAPTWIMAQKGRTIDAEDNIVPVEQIDFANGFLLPITIQLQHAQPISGRLDLLFSTEFHWTKERPLSSLGLGTSWRRWQFNFGLRFEL